MAHQVIKEKCIVCGTCQLECRLGAIFLDTDIKFAVNGEKCVDCGLCANICPVDAIVKVEKEL